MTAAKSAGSANWASDAKDGVMRACGPGGRPEAPRYVRIKLLGPWDVKPRDNVENSNGVFSPRKTIA